MKTVQHGQWGDVRYTSKDCRDPHLCNGNTQGEHYGYGCGIAHQGLEGGERCNAVKVTCSVHRSRLYRDLEQEDKIRTSK